MLVSLSIRDIVLIDKLDLEFDRGLTILTGETGAGKSILLDAFSLALGARGDGGLVRHGQAQGEVSAAFELAEDHKAVVAAKAQDIETSGRLILRRVQLADGRSRAFVNDQSVSAQTLRALAGDLVEIHGQHDERALLDSATHRSLVDAYGGLGSLAQATRAAFAKLRAIEADLARERAEVANRVARFARWTRYVRQLPQRIRRKIGFEPPIDHGFVSNGAKVVRAVLHTPDSGRRDGRNVVRRGAAGYVGRLT